MIELTPQFSLFKVQVKNLLQRESHVHRCIRLERHRQVYTSGVRDSAIYFVESGQIKLVLSTPEGKECLLAIRTAGEIFGELCLSGQPYRLETAVTMEDSMLRQIPHREFIASLKRQSLLEGLVEYLAMRISEQNEIIGAMTSCCSEQRLAKTLLSLGRRMGRNMSGVIHLEHRISQMELSEMVGTTRPRIGIFLKKFRELGLIAIGKERRLVMNESVLEDFIRRGASNERESPPGRSAGMKAPPAHQLLDRPVEI